MGGDHSQKLQPRRRILLLSGAQTSGSLRNQHCSGKLRDGEFADTTFPGQSQARSWLSYGRPGSFLASRPGSLLPRAEEGWSIWRKLDPISTVRLVTRRI